MRDDFLRITRLDGHGVDPHSERLLCLSTRQRQAGMSCSVLRWSAED